MTGEDIETLKQHDHGIVELHLKSREVITARVLFVSESERDVIVDLLSSTMIDMYERSDVQPAFQYLFEDIDRVVPVG